MPPHVYSVAQVAFARLEIATNELYANGKARSKHFCPSQGICLLGRSGAGKSMSTELILEYLVSRPSPTPINELEGR